MCRSGEVKVVLKIITYGWFNRCLRLRLFGRNYITSIIIYLGRQSRVNLVQALSALKPELLSGKIPVALFLRRE